MEKGNISYLGESDQGLDALIVRSHTHSCYLGDLETQTELAL